MGPTLMRSLLTRLLLPLLLCGLTACVYRVDVQQGNLLDQTVNALRNPDHPYRRKLNELFQHRVQVFQKEDLLQGASFSPSVVRE